MHFGKYLIHLKSTSALICFFLFYSQITLSQDNSSSWFGAVEVPPSPGPAAMANFTHNPVNYSTGTADISIPLYTLKGKKINVPIGVRYNSSGIRVEERSGLVGLGWSLQAGGVLTRTVRGLPDETPTYGFMHSGQRVPNAGVIDKQGYISSLKEETYDFVEGIANGGYDFDPDLFSYTTPMGSSEFVFGNTGIPYCNPLKDVVIEPIFASTAGYHEVENPKSLPYALIGWKVVDENGLIYIFGGSLSYVEFTQHLGKGPDDDAFISSWYLKEIIDPLSNEKVSFTYNSRSLPVSYSSYSNESITYKFEQNQYIAQGGVKSSYSRTDAINMKYVSSISLNEETVAFTYGSSQSSEPRLSGINIQSIGGLNKQYNFYYANKGNSSSTYRWLLSKISETLIGGEQSNYVFSYNQKEQLPPYGSTAQDHWGYYNGKTSNPNLIPKIDRGGNIQLGFADKSPSEEHTKAYSLYKIQYPTGGYTKYEYELNDYFSATANSNYTSRTLVNSVTGSGLKGEVCQSQTIIANTNYKYDFELFYEISSDESHPNYDPFHNQVRIRLYDVISGSLLHTYYGSQDVQNTIRFFDLPEGKEVSYRVEICSIGEAILGYTELRYKEKSSTQILDRVPQGGLRVKNIESCDGTGACIERNFYYNESGYRTSGMPQYYFEHKITEGSYPYSQEPHITVFSNSRGSNTNGGIAYQKVTETYKPKTGNETNVSIRYYPKIVDIGGNNAPYPSKWNQGHQRALLTKQEEYKGEYGSHVLVSSTEYLYENVYPAPSIMGFKAIKVIQPHANYNFKDITDFLIENFVWVPSFSRLTREKSVVKGAGTVESILTKDFSYSNSNLYVANRIVSTDSEGNTNQFDYVFPKDLISINPTCTDDLRDALSSCGNDENERIRELLNCQSLYNSCYSNYQACMADAEEWIQSLRNITGTFNNSYGAWRQKDCKTNLTACIQNQGYYDCVANSESSSMNCFTTAYQTYGLCKQTYFTQLTDIFENPNEPENIRAASLFLLLNMNSIPIETRSSKGSNFLTASVLDVGLVEGLSGNSKDAKPAVFRKFYQEANQNLVEKLRVITYDYASLNPTTVVAADGVYNNYLWNTSTKNQLIAHGLGASTENSTIRYTGFEPNQNGGWAFGPTINNAYYSGRYSYQGNEPITTSVSNSGVYIVSCWARKNSSSGTSNSLILTTNAGNVSKVVNSTEWELYEWEVSINSANPNVQVSLGANVLIDDLRLFEKGVLLTTYTYQAGLGLSSSTDPNNRKTLYEYDNLGRLVRVLDAEGKVIKENTYHYAGTSSSSGYSISTSSLSFGDVTVGQSAQRTFTITNTQGYPILIDAIQYPTDFSGNFSSVSIAGGTSKTITVTYTPQLVGPREAGMNIISSTGGPTSIALSANGLDVASRIIEITGSLAFNQVKTGTSKILSVVVKNTGNSTLQIDGISVPSRFSVDWTTASIAAGQSKTLQVTFSPSSYTTHEGVLEIYCNKTAGNNTAVVSGEGVKDVIISD